LFIIYFFISVRLVSNRKKAGKKIHKFKREKYNKKYNKKLIFCINVTEYIEIIEDLKQKYDDKRISQRKIGRELFCFSNSKLKIFQKKKCQSFQKTKKKKK